MNRLSKYLSVLVLSVTTLISCSDDNSSEPVGGDLPAKHIILTDSTFNPEQVIITNDGGAVRFVNATDSVHTVRAMDTTFFKVRLEPYQTYYYRPDTIVSAPLNIPYYCEEHPDTQGLIIIMP